jgi:hypothetical protein
MATKIMREPWLWKRFTSNAIEQYLGTPGEPIIDLRTGVPSLHICDGVTPGGVVMSMDVSFEGIARPTIISPLDGATGVSIRPIITASSFNGVLADGTQDTHVASIWNFYGDANKTNLLFTSGRTTTALTAFDVEGFYAFAASTTVYVEVIYEGSTGGTATSPLTTFTTTSIAPSTPSVTGPTNGSTDVVLRPTLSASAFAIENNETHSGTQFQLATNTGFTTGLVDSGELGAVSSWQPSSNLAEGTQYYARVRYKDSTGDWSAWSAYIGFKTETLIGVGTTLPDGGIVFGQEGGDWLVVAPASQRTTKMWGLYGTDTSLPNWTTGSGTTTTPTDPNSSEYNTDVLTSPTYNSINDGQGSIGSPAAEYCRSLGYDLPNAKDLQLIYNNRAQIDAADGTGNLPTTYVWSSTEYNSYNAWTLGFGNGNWRNNRKYVSNWVVPFRRIPV